MTLGGNRTTYMKYSKDEIERKWICNGEMLPNLKGLDKHLITDKYISESRLRLRKIVDGENNITYKFCKKYGKKSILSEPIVNIYIDENEYNQLNKLNGLIVNKTRYYYIHHNYKMAIDVFAINPIKIIAECEFQSENEANEFIAPIFCMTEVTGIPKYESHNIIKSPQQVNYPEPSAR